MGTSQGAGSGAAANESTQSLDPAALRAGVKLQAGASLKISVKGVSGRPLPSGRKARPLASGDDAADGTTAGAEGSPGGAGGQSVDNSNAGGANTEGGASGAGESGDVHVLAAEVHTIGDSLLVNHPVRVWSIESGQQVGAGQTDEQGVLRINVPKEATYRIEILDEMIHLEGNPALTPTWGNDLKPVLKALFVDKSNKPLANEKISVTAAGKTFQLTSDENGHIQSSGALVPHTLKVRGATFTAHALPAADHKEAANIYRFVVAGKAEAA